MVCDIGPSQDGVFQQSQFQQLHFGMFICITSATFQNCAEVTDTGMLCHGTGEATYISD